MIRKSLSLSMTPDLSWLINLCLKSTFKTLYELDQIAQSYKQDYYLLGDAPTSMFGPL